MRREFVKTRISETDQINLLKFLQSESGVRVIAWLYENSPSPQLNGPQDSALAYGQKIGWENALYFIKELAAADNSEINSDRLDTDTNTKDTLQR